MTSELRTGLQSILPDLYPHPHLMKTTSRFRNATLTGLCLLLMGSAQAAPYAKGSKVESFKANDQHQKEYQFKPADIRHLLVSHDMETGKKANAVLTQRGAGFLGSKNAVYVANIHGMPGIGRTFALPKMRKYAHRIILADDAGLIARFPEEKNKVTVLTLKAGKVTSIQYWDPAQSGELDKLLK